ncbi:MAG TPA: hypothetical protein VNI57_13125, partial [Candidatus Saccharimonadales bacterium]|nr:hypothetical protein [Candidatus Saccharimonadales bacterium]
MRRFSINLATRPFRNNTVYWVGLVLCVAGLSFFTWLNLNLYERSGRETEHWEEVMEGHRTALLALDKEVRTMKSAVADIDLEAFGERSEFANKIIMSRLFSWTSLFDRLEQIQPPKVRLRSIRPSITKTGVEIGVDGLTPDPKALLEFEDALMKSKYFNYVYPHLESEQVKKGELNFSLSFGYDDEAGEKPAAGEAGQGEPAEAGNESQQAPETGAQASAPAEEGSSGAPQAPASAEGAPGA